MTPTFHLLNPELWAISWTLLPSSTTSWAADPIFLEMTPRLQLTSTHWSTSAPPEDDDKPLQRPPTKAGAEGLVSDSLLICIRSNLLMRYSPWMQQNLATSPVELLSNLMEQQGLKPTSSKKQASRGRLLDCLAHFQGLPSWPKLTLPPGPHVLLNPRDETCSVLVYWRTSLHMNKISYNHIQTSEINDSPRSLSLNRV